MGRLSVKGIQAKRAVELSVRLRGIGEEEISSKITADRNLR
jgi:hypothetical protein